MELKKIIEQLVALPPKKLDLDALRTAKRVFAETNKLDDLPSNIHLLQSYRQLLEEGKIQQHPALEELLKKRAIRSKSGIVAVQVLTKPYACPGKCIFCPNDPEMPKSYIKSEPGAMRAWLNQFDPIKQVYNRLMSLNLTGHKTDKIELIVLGGTWDVYPDEYKESFIKGLYDACNTFSQLKIQKKETENHHNQRFAYEIINKDDMIYSKSLQEAITINQTAEQRVIGLTIETRPEYVTDKNCKLRREFGVTRIEMGVQSTDDTVLEANQRGHTIQEVRGACHKMRSYGFKISLHIMPGLFTSTMEKDLKTFEDMFTDPGLKPDEIKFYPTSVIPNTKLYDLWKIGEYKPLETQEIKDLIVKTFLEIIPPYTRIKRLIRDIPAPEIAAGSSITNLSQLVHQSLQKHLDEDQDARQSLYTRLYQDPNIETIIEGGTPDVISKRNFVSLDTRSREMRNKDSHEAVSLLVTRIYTTSAGQEYFISIEDQLGYLYGFTRLLLPSQGVLAPIEGLNNETAMIRELHVYGEVQSLNKEKNSGEKVQHTGYGKLLLKTAEEISKKNSYHQLAIISGIGVREYYKKQAYELRGTYMVKDI